MIHGAGAMHNAAIDFNSAAVRARIWNGVNFKNPGEDIALRDADLVIDVDMPRVEQQRSGFSCAGLARRHCRAYILGNSYFSKAPPE